MTHFEVDEEAAPLSHRPQALGTRGESQFFSFFISVFFDGELYAFYLVGFGAPTGFPKSVLAARAAVHHPAHAGVLLAAHQGQFLAAEARELMIEFAGAGGCRFFGRFFGWKLAEVEDAIDPLAPPVEPHYIPDLPVLGVVDLK